MALTDEQFRWLTSRVCTGIDVPKKLLPVILEPTDAIAYNKAIVAAAHKLGIKLHFVSNVHSADYGKIAKFTRSN